jgi:hypothetical protein
MGKQRTLVLYPYEMSEAEAVKVATDVYKKPLSNPVFMPTYSLDKVVVSAF